MVNGTITADGLWDGAPATYPIESQSVYFDDFYAAGFLPNTAGAGGKFDETADAGEWLVSVTDGGTDNGETIVIDDGGGSGWLVITCNDAANDDVECQKNGEAFTPSLTKDLWFETRFEIEDVSEDKVVVGLTVSDTDVLSTYGNDFMLFETSESGVVNFKMGKNGTLSTNAAIATLVNVTATVGASAKRFGFYAYLNTP